jgi:hypothetical protein
MSATINHDINNNDSNKKQKMSRYVPTKAESVNFDPTSIGLPAGWSLTSFATLKG